MARYSFGSLMDIDKLIHSFCDLFARSGFGSLMDIDKLIPGRKPHQLHGVLVL